MEINWKSIKNKKNKPVIGRAYLVTIKKDYFDDERVVTIGGYDRILGGQLEWSHDVRMIAFAELPEPYNGE